MPRINTPKKAWVAKLKAKYRVITPLLEYCKAKGLAPDRLVQDMEVYFDNVFVVGEASLYQPESEVASFNKALMWNQDEVSLE